MGSEDEWEQWWVDGEGSYPVVVPLALSARIHETSAEVSRLPPAAPD